MMLNPPPITEIAQFNKDHNACRKFQIFAHFAFMWPCMIFGSFLIIFCPNLHILQWEHLHMINNTYNKDKIYEY